MGINKQVKAAVRKVENAAKARRAGVKRDYTIIHPPLPLYAIRHKESGNFLYARTNEDHTIRSGYCDLRLYYLDTSGWRGALWLTDQYKHARIICTTPHLEDLGLDGWEWPSHKFSESELEIVEVCPNVHKLPKK